MISRLLVPSLLVAAFAIFPVTAFACECDANAPSWVASERYRFQSVFVGKVTAIENPEETVMPNGEVRLYFRSTAHLSVERRFRGPAVAVVRIQGAGTDCDPQFVLGRSYLIYDSAGDGSSVGTCNLPVPLEAAGEDLKYIEGTLAKRPQSILYGNVFQREPAAGGKRVESRLTVDVTVVLNGGAGQFRRPYPARSPLGYQLVVAPGDYRVWLERDGKPVSAPQTVQLRDGNAVHWDLTFDRP